MNRRSRSRHWSAHNILIVAIFALGFPLALAEEPFNEYESPLDRLSALANGNLLDIAFVERETCLRRELFRTVDPTTTTNEVTLTIYRLNSTRSDCPFKNGLYMHYAYKQSGKAAVTVTLQADPQVACLTDDGVNRRFPRLEKILSPHPGSYSLSAKQGGAARNAIGFVIGGGAGTCILPITLSAK